MPLQPQGLILRFPSLCLHIEDLDSVVVRKPILHWK